MVKAFHEDGVEERNKASKAKQDHRELWTKLQALSWARSLVWHKVYSGINEHFHLYSLTILWKKKRKKFLLSFFYVFILFYFYPSFNLAKIKELLLFIGMNSLETWVHFLKTYRQMSLDLKDHVSHNT